MPDKKDSEKRTVTLEQLLQLKRSERPQPAFWEEFDRELRRRQLAALVTVKPWHERMAHAALSFLRRSAPVGAAAAALAAGVVVWDRSEHPVAVLQTAEVEHDNRLVVLPEERILPTTFEQLEFTAPQTAATGFRARYVLQQLSATDEPTGSFVVVASPNTLTLSARDSEVYVINTLTSDSAPRTARLLPAAGAF
jgi:hypothetical protein